MIVTASILGAVFPNFHGDFGGGGGGGVTGGYIFRTFGKGEGIHGQFQG